MLVLGLGIIFWLITFGLEWEYPYLYPIFLYINFLLCNVVSPDADQIGITSDEGIIMRTTKKINFIIGFFGILFVAYFLIYAYIISFLGGHRSPASHGHVIGTIGRIIFFNVPGYWFLLNFYSYGLTHWNWVTSIGLYESTKMEIWLFPYMSMQFVGWLIGDEIHLLLDTKWAKGKLYFPKQNKQ